MGGNCRPVWLPVKLWKVAVRLNRETPFACTALEISGFDSRGVLFNGDLCGFHNVP